MYREKKTAQMAAFFLTKLNGSMPHLKLMKLLYISDRESLRCDGSTMSHDKMVSMPHGPVLSQTLDCMNGNTDSSDWNLYITDIANHAVKLNEGISIESLDLLSEFDISIMENVLNIYGKMSKWQIRDETHSFPEWEDPRGSSHPISKKDIALAVGYDLARANQIAEDQCELEDAVALFAAI